MDEALTNRAAAVDAMRAEVEKANTDARQVAALRKTLADSIAGANFLSDKKRNNPLTVALLDDLSRRLPEDTFLERLQIENGEAQLQGQSKEAAKLISLLGTSSCLGDPRLQGQIQPDARTGKERFQIVADIKACNGKPGEVKAPPAVENAPLKTDADATAAPAKSDAAKSAPSKKPAQTKPMPTKPAQNKPAQTKSEAANMSGSAATVMSRQGAMQGNRAEQSSDQHAMAKEPAHGS
jgi:general secretion pathway protein L